MVAALLVPRLFSLSPHSFLFIQEEQTLTPDRQTSRLDFCYMAL